MFQAKEEKKEKLMKEALETAERQAREEKIKSRKNKHKIEMNPFTIPVSEETNEVPAVVGSELKILKKAEETPNLPKELLERNSENMDKKEIEIIQREKLNEVTKVEDQQQMDKNVYEQKLFTRNIIPEQMETVKPHTTEVKKVKDFMLVYFTINVHILIEYFQYHCVNNKF